jgi:predicted ATPase
MPGAAGKFVITGGPGSGKTSLCDALAVVGMAIVGESGRVVIQEECRTGGTALPWLNPVAFAAAVFARDSIKYEAAEQENGPALFDRSFPDNAGYLTVLGLAVPAALDTACRKLRFAEPVLVAPPWKSIYVCDAERKQDWAEAVRTYDAMVASYHHYGYRMVEIPRMALKDRAAFVWDVVGTGRSPACTAVVTKAGADDRQ